jgi:hypothetical protein
MTLQDVLAQYGQDFLKGHKLSPHAHKVFSAILHCRTAVLGAHRLVCDNCGHEIFMNNSCRDRHCPQCQTAAKELWIANQSQYLLNTNYFHAVFTVPASLNPVILQNQEKVYLIFFKAVSETILQLSRDRKYLGATPGITAILHTWGQNMMYHPHIHCIIVGGGLNSLGKWVESSKKFFLPVKVMSKLFRGKFLNYLRKLDLCFSGSVEALNLKTNFASFISGLYQTDWVTYCKPPFEGPAKVIDYLGRYTHRVAISNNRIVSMDDGFVTFSWRDYSDSNKVKLMKLTAVEFIRRFFMHVLPSGFRKIRHYGILASRDKKSRIARCKKFTHTSKNISIHDLSLVNILVRIFGHDFNLCPVCRLGHMNKASPVPATA